MWKISAQHQYNLLQYQRWQNAQYPNEVHNIGGDCINPKCDYHFDPQDIKNMENSGGWFVCPQCGTSYNYLDESSQPGGRTRAGITMTALGDIGEKLVARMGEIPGVGAIAEIYSEYNNILDGQAGNWGLEIKTNHSESQPRFKMGGENIQYGGQKMVSRRAKIQYCLDNNLRQGFVGVRLNFYSDKADIFFRDGFTDTWIGNVLMPHIATLDFTDLNPFKSPQQVPTAADLPDDDTTPAQDDGIPF